MNMDIPVLWWAIRVTGLVAYGGLWLSMMFGLFVAGRGAGGVVHPPSVMELHRQWAVLSLGATLLHGVAAVLAPEGGVPVAAMLIPMVSPVLRVAVTLGTVALWGLLALVLSSHFKAKLSQAAWRGLHATAFAAWVLALAHGLEAGTDVVNRWVYGVLLASAAVLGAAFVQRVVVTVLGAAATKRDAPRAKAGTPAAKSPASG